MTTGTKGRGSERPPARRRPLGLPEGVPQDAAGQDARKYATKNPVVERLIRRWLARLGGELAAVTPEGALVADIGVGEGLALSRVLPPRTTAVGVEFRSDKLAAARAGLPRLLPVVGDAGVLPLRDAAVPTITCIEVLEHLTDPHVAVDELARVTSEACVVSVPWEPWFRLGNLARGKNIGRAGNDPEHVQAFTRRSLVRLLSTRFEHVRVAPAFPWLIGVATSPTG